MNPDSGKPYNVLTVQVPRPLYEGFREFCDINHKSISATIRGFMEQAVETMNQARLAAARNREKENTDAR